MRVKCEGRPGSAGIKSQLGRIKRGLHPHYRATTKHLVLGAPIPLTVQERCELERQMLPSEPVEAAASSEVQGSAPGFPSQASVLAAFGVTEAELPRVRALGQRAAAVHPGSDSESEPDDDAFF